MTRSSCLDEKGCALEKRSVHVVFAFYIFNVVQKCLAGRKPFHLSENRKPKVIELKLFRIQVVEGIILKLNLSAEGVFNHGLQGRAPSSRYRFGLHKKSIR